MLSSLMSDGRGAHSETNHHCHLPTQPCPISSAIHARQLLIRCAELVHCGDLPGAKSAISILSASASPYGDSFDRLVSQFCHALSIRIGLASSAVVDDSSEAFRSSYLLFNQVAPFLRFSHLTANQAILEAIDGRRRVHILDFDTYYGLQWPPLLQAIAERSDPPFIRITGTGSNLEVLQRTGDRLQKFSRTLGLDFKFHPLLLPHLNPSTIIPSFFHFHPSETLVVNCVLFLHKLQEDADKLQAFLRTIRSMNPAVVTMAEREESNNSPSFMHRFAEAVEYYMAVFESLEATLPPTSQERMAVEQVWLRREIEEIIGEEIMRSEGRRKWHRWEEVMRGAGFSSRPLSSFAVAQGRMLLRLHYPSEGYKVDLVGDSFFMGWQNKPLFSVSSWQ
ncbi:hypothetical protein Cni_G22422 [Canna indica]|uniref:Scarecrow-like protein 18 n=1 Tax=Canna indica TaxID=4628 RepID=A0AAQ3QJJ7_9LILI|nr:hypothetical protein Cni_G22422 [Canna indica]